MDVYLAVHCSEHQLTRPKNWVTLQRAFNVPLMLYAEPHHSVVASVPAVSLLCCVILPAPLHLCFTLRAFAVALPTMRLLYNGAAYKAPVFKCVEMFVGIAAAALGFCYCSGGSHGFAFCCCVLHGLVNL